MVVFFNDTATTEIYTLSLHDALPIFETVDETALHVTGTNEFQVVIEYLCPTIRQRHEAFVIAILAQGLSPLCQSIGAEAVFQRMRATELRPFLEGSEEQTVAERNVTFLNKGTHIYLSGTLGAVLGVGLIAQCGLVSRLHVVLVNATVVGAGQDNGNHIGAHARYILAGGNAVAQDRKSVV